jgi:formate dehydrogenase subunit beta
MDCPGVYPLADWINNPDQTERSFTQISMEDNRETLRPVCQVCDKFASTGGEDLHIGITSLKGQIFLIPNGPKGTTLLDKLGNRADKDTTAYQHEIDLITTKRKTRGQQSGQKLKVSVNGLDNLANFFANCISCHNCMRVCPICYCRQCFFDSYDTKSPFEDYLARAKAAGSLRLQPDTMLFHIGRMLHMSLSCVSCGACEDACPVFIPISQLFSLVGKRNQEVFEYTPGRSLDEPLPLRIYAADEFEELEESYTGSTVTQEVKGV